MPHRPLSPASHLLLTARYRRRATLGLALPLLLGAATAAAAEALPQAAVRSVSVSATGTASADPDRAAISTGVMTEAASARDALAQNSTAMRKLIDGLKALGIDAKDIKTTTVNVHPRFNQSTGNRPPTINGYQAINQVRIIVRDLKKIGEILDQSIALGANQMGGIAFEVSNAETLRDAARKAAMINARRRAELYAAASGVSLGDVLTIAETVASPSPRVFAGRAAMAEAAPVEAGSVDLAAEIHVTWALK